MTAFRFSEVYKDGILVEPDMIFNSSAADRSDNFGFIDYSHRSDEIYAVPEINSGFELSEAYTAAVFPPLRQDDKGIYISSPEGEKWPLTFASGGLEPGNYRVRIQAYASEDEEEACVFIGRRHLVWCGSVSKGDSLTIDSIHDVSPIIPRYHEEKADDRSIDVTVLGNGLCLAGIDIEKWQGPVIYIAGDSTVTDQTGNAPYIPERSYGGWGQMLSAFTGTRFGVSNHSHSGLTTESFRSEGHYDIMYGLLKKGDMCLMQFGHNDQKLSELAAEGGYRRNLERYIDEIRDKDAIPVIVTPLARNTWFGNREEYNDLLAEYAGVCKEVAKEKNVKLADLHEYSMNLIKSQGRNAVKKYFYPDDYTHSNDYGAYLFAGYIGGQLQVTDVSCVKSWEPPSMSREYKISSELTVDTGSVKEWLDGRPERRKNHLKRYEALELVINSLHFFPTNVYNDLFEDVVGHEIYAGYIQCAYQNGIFPDHILKRNEFKPDEFITVSECAEYLINGFRSRNGYEAERENLIGRARTDNGYITGEQAAELVVALLGSNK